MIQRYMDCFSWAWFVLSNRDVQLPCSPLRPVRCSLGVPWIFSLNAALANFATNDPENNKQASILPGVSRSLVPRAFELAPTGGGLTGLKQAA